MFGQKAKTIKAMESQLELQTSMIEILAEEIAAYKEVLPAERDIHTAFSRVEDYLIKCSDRLRSEDKRLVYREKHKNSEGNFFASEKKYKADQIDNIIRALYEIEKGKEEKEE